MVKITILFYLWINAIYILIILLVYLCCIFCNFFRLIKRGILWILATNPLNLILLSTITSKDASHKNLDKLTENKKNDDKEDSLSSLLYRSPSVISSSSSSKFNEDSEDEFKSKDTDKYPAIVGNISRSEEDNIRILEIYRKKFNNEYESLKEKYKDKMDEVEYFKSLKNWEKTAERLNEEAMTTGDKMELVAKLIGSIENVSSLKKDDTDDSSSDHSVSRQNPVDSVKFSDCISEKNNSSDSVSD